MACTLLYGAFVYTSFFGNVIVSYVLQHTFVTKQTSKSFEYFARFVISTKRRPLIYFTPRYSPFYKLNRYEQKCREFSSLLWPTTDGFA